jgi:hypothetical protein
MSARHRVQLIADKTDTAKRLITDQYFNVLTNQGFTVTIHNESDTMDDHVIPGYRKRINAGEIINNPCLFVKDSIKTVGTGHFKWTRTNGNIYETLGPGVTHLQIQRGVVKANASDPTPSFALDESAKLQALGNLDRTPYSFGEDIGEVGETLRFLAHPMKSIAHLASEFQETVSKKSKRQRFKSRAKAIADVWATGRFAFSPLVRSVDDAIVSLNDNIHRPKRRTARGFSSDEDITRSDITYNGAKSSSWKQFTWKKRAGILYEVSNPLVDWKFKYGLRFKDIPETLWQLMPLSFMVDRMVNISASLRGLESFLDPNVKILAAWLTSKESQSHTRAYTGFTHPIVQTVHASSPDYYIVENFVYQRETWSPTISDFIPPVRVENLVNSSTKIADLAAIIIQRLK